MYFYPSSFSRLRRRFAGSQRFFQYPGRAECGAEIAVACPGRLLDHVEQRRVGRDGHDDGRGLGRLIVVVVVLAMCLSSKLIVLGASRMEQMGEPFLGGLDEHRSECDGEDGSGLDDAQDGERLVVVVVGWRGLRPCAL
mgnify:CR=1 FL=1